jgi:hypothetical protein
LPAHEAIGEPELAYESLQMNSTHRTLALSLALATTLTNTAWAQEPIPPASPSPPAPPSTNAPAKPPPPPPHPASPSAAAAPAAPALSPVPAPTPAEIQHRRVPVTIESTREDTVIERRVSTEESYGGFIFVLPYRGMSATWEQVCVTPCRTDLDRYSSYRVAGVNGITASSRFTLPQSQSDGGLHMDVDAGDALKDRVGKSLLAIGTAAVIVGGSILVASTSFHHEDDARAAGFITGGAGIVALAVGIPMVIMARSHVNTDGGRKLTFLPDVPLGHGAKLTPRGIVF